MTYQETLDYLYASQPAFHLVGQAAYKPGFENTNKLLAVLDNPHRRFKSIHVAGTNGKGSTSHLLAAILQQAGYKTGLYTSPHLVDFGERIRINGQKIAPGYVIDFVERHRCLLDEVKPSFFECTMAMAFAWFATQQVDIAVIEVGLGGRLDSTNVIMPELSVITNIGFDHTEFLGDTLEKIASEKAGIIKPSVPVIIGETQPETAPVFLQKAADCNSRILFADQEPACPDFPCELHGIYQQKNKQTVYTAIRVLRETGFRIPDDALSDGYAHVCTLTGLQGRWQLVHENPAIICDTGHNAHGIRYVAEQLKQYPCRTLHVVLGMVRDKDIADVLKLLPPQAVYYFTQAQTPRAMPATTLLQMAVEADLHGTAFNSVSEACRQAVSAATRDDLVFVGGSNFVVGEFLADSQEYFRNETDSAEK